MMPKIVYFTGRHLRWAALGAVLGLAVLGLAAWRSRVKYDAHVMCAKCLLHAFVVEDRVFGVTVRRRVYPRTGREGLMSVSLFSPDAPVEDPAVYEWIFGHQCRPHAFKAGGFSNTLRGRYHEDGASGEMISYLPRAEAIRQLFSLCRRLGDRQLARRTYALIDQLAQGTYPYWAGRLDELDQSTAPEQVARDEFMQGLAKSDPAAIDAYALRVGLRNVSSRTEWESLVAQLEGERSQVDRVRGLTSLLEAWAAQRSVEGAAALAADLGRLRAMQDLARIAEEQGRPRTAGVGK